MNEADLEPLSSLNYCLNFTKDLGKVDYTNVQPLILFARKGDRRHNFY